MCFVFFCPCGCLHILSIVTIVTFLGARLTFTVTLFWVHNFSSSHRIVTLTLTITKNMPKNIG
jgi:hypothetical protein